MDTTRIIATVVFVASLVLLGDAWLKKDQPKGVATIQTESAEGPSSVPTSNSIGAELGQVVREIPGSQEQQTSALVTIDTDLFEGVIDLKGGDIVRLVLKEHHSKEDKTKPLTLFRKEGGRTYVTQSGLVGDGLPNHTSSFVAASDKYSLADGSNELVITLTSESQGITVVKTITFERGSYLVKVGYTIKNSKDKNIKASAYYQLLRDGESADGDTRLQPTYTGAAVYTDESKFTKVDFKDMDKAKAKYPSKASDGWISFIQHYFLAAWIPKQGLGREYYTKALGGGLYSMGVLLEPLDISPGTEASSSADLYVGPQTQKVLESLAPGLDLVVDYGWLTIIASPLFWLLTQLHGLIGNWGFAIVVLTIIIKLVFFPLSAAGYKSMAKMRVLGPKLQSMKETYGDDRQRMQQAMMELYKKEKINPLGGCLPILVQIPFFIALYWVLLASVELRDAPFVFWIQDLSAKDPYYVLPVLMALSMIAQSWLSPSPPDPVQAKIMKIMPLVFSIFFFFFPAGLVLYWLVNNILSIAQQWTITRAIEGGKKPAHGKR